MTCRHDKDDPNCSSHRDFARSPEGFRRAEKSESEGTEKYEVLDVEQVGANLALKVRYPSCAKCSFEGVKIMVFCGVSLKEAMMWRRIDPHFRDTKPSTSQDAPSPAARFAPTSVGWADALEFARF